MSGRHLLDTNIVIALLEGDPEVERRLAEDPEIFLSLISLGELQFGIAKSGRPEAHQARLDSFVSTCTLLGIDAETSRISAESR